MSNYHAIHNTRRFVSFNLNKTKQTKKKCSKRTTEPRNIKSKRNYKCFSLSLLGIVINVKNVEVNFAFFFIIIILCHFVNYMCFDCILIARTTHFKTYDFFLFLCFFFVRSFYIRQIVFFSVFI